MAKSTWKQTLLLSLLLAGVLTLILPLVAWYGHARHGQLGVVAAVVAAGVCLFAGGLALAVTHVFSSIGQAMNGLLLSMLIRSGVPLLAGLGLSQSGPLAGSGVFGMMVINYLVMLMVETVSAVKLVGTVGNVPSRTSGSVSRAS